MYKRRGNFTSVKEVVLQNTGLSEDELLNPEIEPYIHNLDKAVDKIQSYIRNNPDGVIWIVGDYDGDGIDATAIMYFGLRYAGVKNVRCRIPRRFSEGYGLSEHIIKEIADCINEITDEAKTGDVGLIITVDNGIAAADAIKRARLEGFTVVVTDHHLAPVDEYGTRILPPADVIVDPAADDESEYKSYCGAGLAYRLVKRLLNDVKLPQLAALASIATITDVVNVTGANRVLLQFGLTAVNERRILPGLDALLSVCEMNDHITEDDYGFRIGPMFNASSRMHDDGADDVLDLITSLDERSLRFKAKMVKETNDLRKKESEIQVSLADEMVGNERPIVVCSNRFTPGIIGIIAGRLAEKYHCPAIALSVNEDGSLKGSGRTIPEVHLKNALDKCQTYLNGYGGHAGAAGLSLKPENLEAFKRAFKEACGPLPKQAANKEYDLEITAEQLPFVVNDLKVYAPYGEGNPKPVFHMVLELKDYHVMTGDDSFTARSGDLKVFGFRFNKKYIALGKPGKIDAIGYISENWYKGEMSYQFELVDFESIS